MINMPRARYKKRKDGRYETKIDLGYDDSGRRIRKSVSAKTSAELERKVEELRVQIRAGQYVKDSEMTMYEYADMWLNTYKAIKSINTQAMYRNIIEAHIKESIGMMKIKNIKSSDIQVMINERSDRPRICQQIMLTLKQIYKSINKDQLLPSHTCDFILDGISVPKYVAKEKRALTDKEKEALIKADFTLREKAFVMILFYFGLRREEALALMKNDFDMKKQTLHVQRALVYDKNTPVLKDSTKSFAGNRVIDIPTAIYPFLRDYLSSLDTLYLFTNKSGSLVSQSGYTKMWKSILKKMNDAVRSPAEAKMRIDPIEGLTAHIFRHNYCTMLYYSGLSLKKTVQLMGHSDTQMIMKVYAHLDDAKENTKDKINANIKLG